MTSIMREDYITKRLNLIRGQLSVGRGHQRNEQPLQNGQQRNEQPLHHYKHHKRRQADQHLDMKVLFHHQQNLMAGKIISCRR